MRKLIFICIYLSLAIPCAADIIYVDNDADGFSDGSSWEDAYSSLQVALDDAAYGDDIWVAEGTYYPTSDHGLGIGDRGRHFRMKNGVAIYGGFPTDGSDFENRDPNQYQTILSGDIGIEGDNNDNCYHVFYHSYSNLDATAILDGFTITSGIADGDHPHNGGGGMRNVYSSPKVTNCTFTANSADNSGGGMLNVFYSSPTVTNCTFTDNTADYGGGMLNLSYSNSTVTNCTFIGNSALRGGGMYNNWYNNPIVTNCTFTGNSADDGGGMYNNYHGNPTVTNCTFSANSADNGGGMSNNYFCSPTVTDCTFTNNSVDHWGGGMYNDESSPTVTGCTFTDNSAYFGGGLLNFRSSPKVTNCTFTANSVNRHGGGLGNFNHSSPTVTGCTFSRNSADYFGGGMYNERSATIVNNCTFTDNSADGEYGDGGGMYNWDSSPTVTNCKFTSNSAKYRGGGMSNASSSGPTVTNCTFSNNSADWDGGGIYNWISSSPKVINCILWGNSATNGNEIALAYSSAIDVDYCDVQDGLTGIYDDASGNTINWGTGNIDIDPEFMDSNNGDLHLLGASPCIDAGDPNYIADPNETDIDGNPRIIDGDGDGVAIVDMGAYEVVPPSIQVSMNFTPTTLNCSSQGNWVKAHFVLPEGFSTEDVDTDKPATIDSLTFSSDHINVSYNDEGLVEIEVAFSRNDFCSFGHLGDFELTVRGWLIGQTFYGTDAIRITTNKFEQLPEFFFHWLQTDCTSPDFCDGFDLDRNGIVDLADFVLLGKN